MSALFRFVLGVAGYSVAASVLAWAAGWPPQFGGNPDPEQSYLSYLFGGSAISAPLPPLVALLVGGALTRGRRAWRYVGLVMIAIVAVLFVIGVFGEFAAEHPHVPATVIYGFGSITLLLALTLLILVIRELRAKQGLGDIFLRNAPL